MGRQTSTHCKNGHERTPDNLYKGGNCKKCMQLARLMKVMNVTAVEDIVKSSKSFIPQTHCLRGHERTPNNVEKAGGCKECNKLHDKARRLLKVVKPKIVKCRNGHERTPESTYKNGKCKLCKSEQQKKYLQNPENKTRHAAAMKAYQQTEKRQAYLNSSRAKEMERIRTQRKRIKRVSKRTIIAFDWVPCDTWKMAA